MRTVITVGIRRWHFTVGVSLRVYGSARWRVVALQTEQMADGILWSIVFSQAAVQVHLQIPPEVNPVDSAAIIRDSEMAQQHIILVSRLKFVTWNHLPLRICGISDADALGGMRISGQFALSR